MIPASLYYYVYLFVVTLMTFYTMSLYNKLGKQYNTRSASKNMAFLLLIFVVYFIGTRPLSTAFGDMGGYEGSYGVLLGERFYFNSDAENLIWDNFFNWMASKNIPFTTWVLIVATVYFGLIYIACRKMFEKDILLAFVVYLGAFSTFSYGTNGVKAGVAASMFLVAIAYRDKLWVSVPLAFFAYGFHHSMTFVIAAYIVTLFVRNPKYYFVVWIVCLISAALHITTFQTIFASFTDERGAGYLLSRHNSGFRPDFILYSAAPIYLGYVLINKYKVQSDTYSFLLRLYIMTNAMWMLCMYANYNNRIAYLSWFMYPFVLLYPVISRERNQIQGRLFRWVVYGHLAFTLFMTFIYY